MAVFDLYTLQMVALPYYTGFVAHRPGGGTVAAFHPATATLGEFLSRLTAFKAPVLIEPVMAALWVLYTAATVGVAVLAWAAARRAPACEGD